MSDWNQRRSFPEGDGHETHMDNENNVINLELDCVVSSREIKIRWKRISDEDTGNYWLHVEKRTPPIGNTEPIVTSWDFPRAWNETEGVFKTTPGCTYRVTVTYKTRYPNEVIAYGTTTAVAHFSQDEMHLLMKKASDFAENGLEQIQFLYRCKPKGYWEQILNWNGGIMKKYEKDYSGQPANPINGKQHGLFFGSKLKEGKLPEDSPFGDTRFKIPAKELLRPTTKLYFCDFYCITKAHYVTIVACEEGSEADKFCQEKLIPLTANDNPFFMFFGNEENPAEWAPVVLTHKKIWVEVYIMEDVDIKGPDSLDVVRLSSERGSSTPGGTYNNKSCSVCNL